MNDGYQLAQVACITTCICNGQYVRVLSEVTDIQSLMEAVQEHLGADSHVPVILISIIRLMGDDYDYLLDNHQYEVLL